MGHGADIRTAIQGVLIRLKPAADSQTKRLVLLGTAIAMVVALIVPTLHAPRIGGGRFFVAMPATTAIGVFAVIRIGSRLRIGHAGHRVFNVTTSKQAACRISIASNLPGCVLCHAKAAGQFVRRAREARAIGSGESAGHACGAGASPALAVL